MGFGIARDLGYHRQGDRFDSRPAIAAVRPLAVNRRFRRHGIKVHGCNRIDRIDQADRIRPTPHRRSSRFAHIGDIGRQLYDHRLVVILLAPARDHFDIFRDLPDSRPHAPFGHPVRAAKIQLDPVSAGFRNAWQNILPRLFFTWHHDRHDHCAVWIVGLDAGDFIQIGLQGPVGDQLDIVEPQQPPVRPIDRTIARAIDVDDRWSFGPQRLPDHTAPARLERAADVVFLVRWRGRGQPERVRGCDPQKICCQISHFSCSPSRLHEYPLPHRALRRRQSQSGRRHRWRNRHRPRHRQGWYAPRH